MTPRGGTSWRLRPRRGSPDVFVGRDRERAIVGETLVQPPSLVVIEGDVGVGKSRLLMQVLADAGRGDALIAMCHHLPDPFPFGAVVEALRRAPPSVVAELDLSPVAASLRALLPEWSGLLPPDLTPAGDARTDRHRVLRGLREVLEGLQCRTLVIEDLHWADAATIELLTLLLADPIPRLSIVVTTRPRYGRVAAPLLGARPRGDTVSIRVVLQPLAPPETGELVMAVLGADEVSEELIRFIHDRTDGLPLAVEQVLDLLLEREDIAFASGRWVRRRIERMDVPVGYRDSVLERCSHLDPDETTLLGAMAVVGEAAPETLLAAVADVEDHVRCLDAIMQTGLVVERSGCYSFRHDLARETIYEAIAGPERGHMHRAAARALTIASGSPARISHHHLRGGSLDAAIQWARTAAREAAAVGNFPLALSVLAEPLGLVADLTNWVEAVLELARVSAVARESDQAVQLLTKVASSDRLPYADRGRVHIALARAHARAGRVEQARRDWIRAAQLLEHEPASQAEALARVAQEPALDEPVESQLRWLEQARAAAARAGGEALVRTEMDAAYVLLYVGRGDGWPLAGAIPTDAATAAEASYLVRGHANVARACIYLGYLARAEEHLHHAERLISSHDLVPRERGNGAVRALLRWYRGEWDSLLETADAAAREDERSPHVMAWSVFVRASLLRTRGRVQDAADELERCAQLAVETRAFNLAAVSAAARARTSIEQLDLDAVIATLEPVVRTMSVRRQWMMASEVAPPLALSYVLAQRRAEAERLAAEIEGGLEGCDAPAAAAALESVRELLEPASTRAGRGSEAWAAVGFPYHAALADEYAAVAAVAVAAPDEAVAARLARARSGFATLGATSDEARVARAMRKLGLAAPRPFRGGRGGYGQTLTPREEEVVALVRQGLTNREIGRALFLSEHTVAHYLTSAMRKLNVATRRELRAQRGFAS